MIVSDVTRGRMLRLPWDYRELCGADPNEIPVADSVRSSASIPFFFRPFHFACKLPGDTRELELTFVDGGLLSNFPVWLFDRKDGAAPRWPTFGIKLSARPTGVDQDLRRTDTAIGMTFALVATLASAHDRFYVDQPSVQDRTVFVDTTGVKSTDFNLTDAVKTELFENGHAAATKFAGSWDWAAWQKKYGSTTAG